MCNSQSSETVCYVKPASDGPAVVRKRFLFEALFGPGVKVAVGSPPRDRGSFLRLFCVPKQDRPDSAHICIQADAWSSPCTRGKGKPIFLRNIRCSLGDGVALCLIRCCACGFAAIRPEDMLVDELLRRCPRCKAAPAQLKCEAWHTYGICEHCTDEKIDDCPFVPTASGSERAVASHISSS